ncbi:hypothetical protein [Bdellovibrio sp.]|uniref:hypothetical protein n=1 Tax=Bdellovibrio sp. TaxID=28201 RepID=UPI0039E71DCC
MKRLVKAMATTAVTLMAIQANAIQVNYSFRVNSSGPSIYPCNAGLLTEDKYGGDKVACYTATTHEACTPKCEGLDCDGGFKPKPHSLELISFHGGGPTPPPPSTPDPKNACVCTTDKGRKYGNYLHVSHRPWGESVDPTSNVVSSINTGKFAQTFNEVDAYKNVLEKLSFNLGTELYNAKYFVDICYRGSQIDYTNFATKWNVLAEASVTDYGFGAPNDGYSEMAGLKHKAYVICSLQNRSCADGECDDKNWVIDSNSVPQFNDLFLSSFMPIKADFKYQGSSHSTSSGGFTELVDLTDKDLKDLRATKFCKIRYVFEETNGDNPTTAKQRKWQKHGADVCTHSKIEMSYLADACAGGDCR